MSLVKQSFNLITLWVIFHLIKVQTITVKSSTSPTTYKDNLILQQILYQQQHEQEFQYDSSFYYYYDSKEPGQFTETLEELEYNFNDNFNEPDELNENYYNSGYNHTYGTQSLPKCPTGLEYQIIQGMKVCYLITNSTTYPPSCPYLNTVNLKLFAKYPYLTEITSEKLWAYATTDIFDGFGEDFVAPDLSVDLHENHKTYKNCLIFDGLHVTQASCTDKYPGVCVYGRDQILPSFDNYCKSRYNESCIASEVGFVKKCFCLSKTISGQNKSRNTFCKKLAEIPHPYQNSLLTKNLLKPKERCWIGLQKQSMENLQWLQSETPINYTFWSPGVDYSKPFGGLALDGWFLEKDGVLNCAICEIDVKVHGSVKLQIKYNPASRMIDAKIGNQLAIYDALKCYDYDKEILINLPWHNKTSPLKLLNVLTVSEIPHYYWCKVLQLPDLTPVYSNRIIASDLKEQHRHQYVLYVNQSWNMESEVLENIKLVDSIKYMLTKRGPNKEAVYHITTVPTNFSIKQEIGILSNFLETLLNVKPEVLSNSVCLESTTFGRKQTLHWPEAPIGTTVVPKELCLNESGMPVTRKCIGNLLHGGKWSNVNGTCSQLNTSPKARMLENLLGTEDVSVKTVADAIQKISKPNALEFYLFTRILENLSKCSSINWNVTEIGTMMNQILNYDKQLLKESQKQLNSTNRLLDVFDQILTKLSANSEQYDLVEQEKLSIQISDLRTTDVIGVKLTKNKLGQKILVPLHAGRCLENVFDRDTEIIISIPQELKNDILKCLKSNDLVKLIVTIFYNDVLFNDYRNLIKPVQQNVVSVTIPGFNCAITTPLQILYKKAQQNFQSKLKCGYWDYANTESMENNHGHWITEQSSKEDPDFPYHFCEFFHTTHFSLLVVNEFEIDETYIKALDIIALVGCGLSIVGLITIFIVAISFKRYRSTHAIVINFAITMTAEIILTFLADRVGYNPILCVGTGIALHYVILSHFCWMLLIADNQYCRYVLVFKEQTKTKFTVVKQCLFSWCFPFICIIVISLTVSDDYGKNTNNFCYAIGNNFLYGIVLPVSVALIDNFIIFSKILFSILLAKNVKGHTSKSYISFLQLRLAIMLYFLVGLTWCFGILVAIGGGIVYSCLFCLTSTLQGFVLFLFFVVLDEETRILWVRIKSCFCINKSRKYELNPRSNSNKANLYF